MCGIFGFWRDGDHSLLQETRIREIAATMSHRGPDDEGVYINGSVALAHRRLSIIDLSTGHQPLFNENGDVAVILNGEIYNYLDLKRSLVDKGHRFRTSADTEVIVHGYEEWAEDCVERFQGMFAIAVYDSRKKRLFVARDRLGIKPLYYFCDDRTFIFSSEIKPILRTGLVTAEVNRNSLDFYSTIGYVPSPDTAFTGIYKLEPGHTLSYDGNLLKKRTYWSLPTVSDTPATSNYRQSCEQLMELLTKCVRSHLASDVPVGAFLSGGLDSSIVVALMKKELGGLVKTFSVGYEDARESNELEFAKVVATRFQTEHYEYLLQPDDFIRSVGNLVYHMEEPIVESAAIALYRLSQLARSKAIVLLSGEGADEIFGGYPLYWKMGFIDRLYMSRRHVPLPRLRRLRNCLPEKYLKYLYWMSVPFEQRYKTVASDVVPEIWGRMSGDGTGARGNGRVQEFFDDNYRRLGNMSVLRKMQYIDTKYWLPDDLLTKADKMTMATSVELRVPFLDHVMVEFALRLPDEYKVGHSEGKLILKDLAKDILPREIVYRRKKGFPVPISKWFSGDIRSLASDILLDRRTIGRGIVNRQYMERILSTHREGSNDNSRRIMSLIIMEIWFRMYIDRAGSEIKKVCI